MTSTRILVDWSLAERVAAGVATGMSAEPGGGQGAYSPDLVERACVEAIELAAERTGLGAVASPPLPELLSRREWAANALRSLAEASAPLERRLVAELDLPSPLGSIARRAAAAAAGAEAGVAVGYVGRRVLGQYDVAMFGPQRPSRLLFVAENMAAAQRALDAEPGLFLRWVAVHETTHVVQLERVGWLRGHIRGLAGELVDGAARGIESSSLRGLAGNVVRDPRAFLRAALRGELSRLLADPRMRSTLDRLQATMSVVEGHAEHVMDSAAAELGPGLPALRERLERRRESRGAFGGVIGRLLGVDLKLRQYKLGKAFCDGVATAGGPAALRLLWRSAGDLPDLTELEHPERWLARVGELSSQPA